MTTHNLKFSLIMLLLSIFAEATIEQEKGIITYNTKYTQQLRGMIDVNGSTLVYRPNAVLFEENSLILTLDRGAEFGGVASDWTMASEYNNTKVGEVVSLNKNKMVIKVNAFYLLPGKRFFIQTIDDNFQTHLKLNTASEDDINLHIVGKNHRTNKYINGTESKTTVFYPVQYKMESLFTCTQPTLINTDKKTEFLVSSKSSAITTHSTKCRQTVGQYQIADVDFDYSDINITTTIKGYFKDGTFSTDHTANEFSRTDPSALRNIQQFEFQTTDLGTKGFQADYLFSLNKSNLNILSSRTYTFTSKLTFNTHPNLPSYTLPVEHMQWYLSTYMAKILPVESSPSNATYTYIQLYNTDKKQDAIVDLQITTTDGRTLPLYQNITTVPAGGTTTLSSKDINTAIQSEDLQSGYTATVTYRNVSKHHGNAVASYNNTLNTFQNIRIKQNNPVQKNHFRGL